MPRESLASSFESSAWLVNITANRASRAGGGRGAATREVALRKSPNRNRARSVSPRKRPKGRVDCGRSEYDERVVGGGAYYGRSKGDFGVATVTDPYPRATQPKVRSPAPLPLLQPPASRSVRFTPRFRWDTCSTLRIEELWPFTRRRRRGPTQSRRKLSCSRWQLASRVGAGEAPTSRSFDQHWRVAFATTTHSLLCLDSWHSPLATAVERKVLHARGGRGDTQGGVRLVTNSALLTSPSLCGREKEKEEEEIACPPRQTAPPPTTTQISTHTHTHNVLFEPGLGAAATPSKHAPRPHQRSYHCEEC